MNDGFELIAKVPHHSTLPRRFTTESEVAILEFLRLKGIPAPQVYAWSSTQSNAVGTEYIIMAKARGKPLEEIWFNPTPKERVRLVTSFVDMERKPFDVPFGAYGSLYYRNCGLESDLQANIYDDSDDHGDTGRFCIGPSTDIMFWHGRRAGLNIDRGRCMPPSPPLANSPVVCTSVR